MKTFDTAIRAVYQSDYKYLSLHLGENSASEVDEDGRTLLMHAVLASEPHGEMITFLINNSVPINATDSGQEWTALHFAARDKLPAIVELLLRAGAKVNPIDSFGNTPLARALNKLPFDVRTIQLLVAAGADASLKNFSGKSPLDVARLMGKPELTHLLQSK